MVSFPLRGSGRQLNVAINVACIWLLLCIILAASGELVAGNGDHPSYGEHW